MNLLDKVNHLTWFQQFQYLFGSHDVLMLNLILKLVANPDVIAACNSDGLTANIDTINYVVGHRTYFVMKAVEHMCYRPEFSFVVGLARFAKQFNCFCCGTVLNNLIYYQKHHKMNELNDLKVIKFCCANDQDCFNFILEVIKSFIKSSVSVCVTYQVQNIKSVWKSVLTNGVCDVNINQIIENIMTISRTSMINIHYGGNILGKSCCWSKYIEISRDNSVENKEYKINEYFLENCIYYDGTDIKIAECLTNDHNFNQIKYNIQNEIQTAITNNCVHRCAYRHKKSTYTNDICVQLFKRADAVIENSYFGKYILYKQLCGYHIKSNCENPSCVLGSLNMNEYSYKITNHVFFVGTYDYDMINSTHKSDNCIEFFKTRYSDNEIRRLGKILKCSHVLFTHNGLLKCECNNTNCIGYLMLNTNPSELYHILQARLNFEQQSLLAHVTDCYFSFRHDFDISNKIDISNCFDHLNYEDPDSDCLTDPKEQDVIVINRPTKRRRIEQKTIN